MPTDLKIIPKREPINLDKLKEEMLKGAIALQSGIWNHASYENTRLHRARAFQSRLEEELFTEHTLSELSTKGKVNLYELVSSNILDSMNYLQKLSHDTQQNISALEEIKAKTEESELPTTEDPADKANLDIIKKMILAKIREKSSKP